MWMLPVEDDERQTHARETNTQQLPGIGVRPAEGDVLDRDRDSPLLQRLPSCPASAGVSLMCVSVMMVEPAASHFSMFPVLV
jgi:hypothetical protein